MSTRCQLGFYRSADQSISRPTVVLYRHCDGYPDGDSGVLATLVPWAITFQQRRGLSDAEYAGARALEALIRDHVPGDVLSYGICDPAAPLHGDIEFYYRIDPSGISVYEYSDGWPTKRLQFVPVPK